MTSTPQPSDVTLIGLTWTDTPADGLVPDAIIRTGHLLPSERVPLLGRRLQYRATERRLCLGHRPAGEPLQDCRRAPDAGGRRCGLCQSREAGFAQNLHHAHTRNRQHLDPQVLEHLRQPNMLYLAGFRDGSVKVGTSTASRLTTRLTEQGAWMARVVAEAADGFVVREIEDHVTEFLGVPQAVSINRKLDGMVNPIDDAQIERVLAGYGRQVQQLVTGLNDDRLQVADRTFDHPRAGATVWTRPFRYPLDLAEGNHDIEVLDACGRMVALQRPGRGDDVFVADIGRLFGVITSTDHEPAPEIAVQDSLF